ELYPQLRDALCTHGFLYAINHGYTQAQHDRIFNIAGIPFNNVSPDEKKMYADIEKVGYYAGYKPRQFWKVDTDNQILDQILHPILRSVLLQVPSQCFSLRAPLYSLIVLSLELPEETLVEKHNFDRTGETSVRFIKYYRCSNDEEEKSKNVWLKGHTDIGSITVLWSQPIGGLQIMAPDSKWKWVRHIDDGHRYRWILQAYDPLCHPAPPPPSDQCAYDRLGAYYFAMPDNDIRLLPCAESPVLKRQCLDDDSSLCETWRKERTMLYGRTGLKSGVERGVEEEVIEGIVVKHYN
ncbi:uncharacterized protein F5147DRAFT_576223, partial [Suillus discolor]